MIRLPRANKCHPGRDRQARKPRGLARANQARLDAVLRYLADWGPSTVADMAGELHYAQAVVYRALHHLRKRGWVEITEREPGLRCPRNVYGLTDAGMAAAGPELAQVASVGVGGGSGAKKQN